MKAINFLTFNNQLFNQIQCLFAWTPSIGHQQHSYIQNFGQSKPQNVTLIEGFGIGPEITQSVEKIIKAINCPINFDKIPNFNFEDQNCKQLLKKNQQIVLGVLPYKKDSNFSENIDVYRYLNLFAHATINYSIPTPNQSMKKYIPHDNIDIVVFRENSEGEYSGIEHEVVKGVIESIKVTSIQASRRIAQYAFEFAYLNGRKKVTAVHKANIMKICDGLFLKGCREVAEKYPKIKYEEMIIDNCTMQLVKNPSQFDVMVMPNLYGAIVQNICAGITGGVGMTSGVCIGNEYFVFCQGCRHSGTNIAGQNIANPSALIRSVCIMLRRSGLPYFADLIKYGLRKTLLDNKIIPQDLGGNATTSQYTDEIIKNCLNL